MGYRPPWGGGWVLIALGSVEGTAHPGMNHADGLFRVCSDSVALNIVDVSNRTTEGVKAI
jgi:hypothetical protein